MRAPDFWSPGHNSPLATVLAPFGCLYGAVTHLRATRAASWQAPVPVICVGNAVMGGAGKTQVCIDLVKLFSKRGTSVHVLSRGYGGSIASPVRVDPAIHSAHDVGDEALVLARHAPCWVGADRTATAKAATAAGAALLIMDDGYQNPALARDVNLLVIDADYGFGNGHVFPAGPLRETAQSAFARADAALIIGEAGPGLPALPTRLPHFDARIRPAPDAPDLADKKVIAFAGIGRPEKFFRTLREAGAEIVQAIPFADHHPYAEPEIAALLQTASDGKCLLVTTEKDHQRLPSPARDRVIAYPVYLTWQDASALESFLIQMTGLN